MYSSFESDLVEYLHILFCWLHLPFLCLGILMFVSGPEKAIKQEGDLSEGGGHCDCVR